MKRRIRLKRRNYIFKKKKSNLIVFIVILLIVCIVLLFKFINLKVNPVLLDYAEIESKKLASVVINNAVSQNVTNIDIDELFLITRDDKNEIKTIDFNPITVNKVLTNITREVQNNLKDIEQGKTESLSLGSSLSNYNMDNLKKGIICEIPSGVIFNNSILSNLGPKIPVKLSLVGSIIGHINTKVTDYGINSALIEVNIVLELSEQVVLPFVRNKVEIETTIPIALKLIQGSVPNYYLNGIDRNSPSITVPIE